MSTVAQPEAEFARHFSIQHRGLLSYRRDGRILLQCIEDPCFRRFLKKKDEVPLDQWIAKKQMELRDIPAWCFDVRELPSMEELEEWGSDSHCDTPTGYSVEPDGVGPDGVPSWLRCLGLI